MTHMTPARFAQATLADYRLHTESQELGYEAVLAWISAVRRGEGPMLALIGPQGTGKSHLLYAALHELCRELPRGTPMPYAAPWYRLADELRYGRTVQTEAGGRELSGAHVRADLWSRVVVLLDEVRRTAGTDFDDTELVKFACHAYDHRSALLITTNTNPLEAVMGAAAASRFAQVVIDGPDYRNPELAIAGPDGIITAQE